MNVSTFVLLALLAQNTNSSPSPEAKARAQVLLSEGAQLFEKGAMAKALEKFNQAYDEFPSPKLLFNIGQTNRNLGLLVEAIKAFERFLATATDAPYGMTTEAKKCVAEISAVVGRLGVECNTIGAEISVDGTSVGFAPLSNPLWVMPGNHLVTARHPSYSMASVGVDIDPGTVHTVVLPMQPNPQARISLSGAGSRASVGKSSLGTSAASPGTAASTNLATSPGSTSSDDGWWLGRRWAWVATASAVVFAGTAAGFGWSMQSKFDSLNKSCGSASADYPGCDDISAVTWRRNTANVFWGLSAAAAATAGVLFLVEGHDVSVTPVAGESIGLIAHTRY